MSDIYFDSSANEIIDDWIKDVDTNPFAEKTSVRVAGMAGDSRNNFGLGFDAKTKGGPKAGEESNALIESIKKKKAKAKLSNKDLHYELHGVVDEGEELSRTNISSKKAPKGVPPPRKTDLNAASTSKLNISDAGSVIASVVKSGEDVGHPPVNSFTKRPKTRSKQKNIRRDKRALEHKPDHLQIGSKEYRGRPITAVRYLTVWNSLISYSY
jgi:hypothetical protein